MSQFAGLHVLIVFGQRLGQHQLGGKHGLVFCIPVALRQQVQVVGDLGEGGLLVCEFGMVGGGGPERPSGECEAQVSGGEGCALHLHFSFVYF